MVPLTISLKISPKFCQHFFSKWTRAPTENWSHDQLDEKAPYCEDSKAKRHNTKLEVRTIPGDKYQISRSDFAKEVQKIFPSAKSSPYEKAIRFLEQSCSPVVGYQTRISPSSNFDPVIPLKHEVFSNAIMHDLLKDLSGISPIISFILLEFIENNRGENGLFSFFVDNSFRTDVDTSSACLTALLDGNRIHAKDAKAAAKILTLNTNAQGVVEVFLPSEKKLGGRPGVLDAGILSNMMGLLCRLGMDSEAKASQDFIYTWISNSNFKSLRTKHYPPEAVLYFASNSIRFVGMRERFQMVLAKHLLESFGTTTKALALAQRILVAHNLGFLDKQFGEGENCRKLMGPGKYEELKREVRLLRRLQNEITGGWDLPGSEFHHCSRFFWGSEDIVTAFAAKALYHSQEICD